MTKLLLALFLTYISLVLTGNVPEYEISALFDLYSSTDGVNWHWPNASVVPGIPWNFTQDDPNPCVENWQGLTCSLGCENSVQCNIELIDLNGYRLNGTLPASLGNFTNLVALEMSYSVAITGTIPAQLGLLSRLELLLLGVNRLSGTIPKELGQTNLTFLELEENNLSGTIPDELGQLSNLIGLYLQYNQLNGTIPASLGNMTNLATLALFRNDLTGPIPTELYQLHKLEYLGFHYNALSGPIADDVNQLDSMQYFAVNNNDLSGTLPAGLGALTQMDFLAVAFNSINGTIPPELGQLVRMEDFLVHNNLLTGTVPPELGLMTKTVFFDMNTNYLSGPIPSELGNLVLNTQLEIYGNYLTGPIPVSLANMALMQYFEVQLNLLSGTVPAEIAALHLLTRMVVNNNRLTGSLPDTLNTAVVLQALLVQENHFYGTIPTGVSKCKHLVELNVSTNYFTGPLFNPVVVGNASLTVEPTLYALKTLDVSSNLFSGRLGTYFQNLSGLSILFLQENLFSGTLDGLTALVIVDVPSAQSSEWLTRQERTPPVPAGPALRNVDLSVNAFSGSLPTALFSGGKLKSFAALKNCFTGTLPQGICTAQALESLALDGLSTGSSCRQPLFPRLATTTYTYASSDHVAGKLPLCLFGMQNLQFLHLSGNSLTGNIPGDVALVNLTDLSLSHNKLTGTIPLTFQTHAWDNLDLSFNHFDGTLSDAFATFTLDSSLDLQVNRLSGDLPSGIVNSDCQDVNILRGNIFACTYADGGTEANLPQHDSGRKQYVCGSDSLNNSLYVWCAIVAVAVSMVAVWWYAATWSSGGGRLVDVLSRWWTVFTRLDAVNSLRGVDNSNSGSIDATSSENVYFLGKWLNQVTLWCVTLCTGIVVTFLPIYATLSHYYGTYAHQYAWQLSLGFLCGQKAGGTLFVLFVVLLLAIHYSREIHFMDGNTAVVSKQPESPLVDWWKFSCKWDVKRAQIYAFLITLVCANIATIVTVNGLYVYATVTVDASVLDVLALFLAAFKITWYWLLQYMDEQYLLPLLSRNRAVRAGTTQEADVLTEKARILLLSCLMLFNTIVAPCVATAFVDPDCFYYAITPAPAIDTTYTFTICKQNSADIAANACRPVHERHSYSYVPPFSYSYQCSSALLTSYSYVYVYKFLYVGILSPLIILFVKATHHRYFGSVSSDTVAHKFNRDASPALTVRLGMVVCRFLVKCLPRLVRPLSEYCATAAHVTQGTQGAQGVGTGIDSANPLWKTHPQQEALHAGSLSGEHEDSVRAQPQPDDTRTHQKSIFAADQFAVIHINYIAILLTFGVAFPPLACVIALAFVSVAALTKLLLGRFICAAVDCHRLDLVSVVNAQCDVRSIKQTLLIAAEPVVVLVPIFYAFFLFDTLGDAVGAKRAVLVVVVLVAMPLWVWPLKMLLRNYAVHRRTQSTNGIELADQSSA